MASKSFDKNNDFNIKKISSPKEIHNALFEISSAYNPPLTTSIKDLYEFAAKLAMNAEVFVAIDQSVLGLIAFYCNNVVDKIGYITQVGVKTSAQSSGLGKQLMDKAYSVCKTKGMQKIKLEVKKNNSKAIIFYKKQGFKECGDASEYSIYMERSL
ncbi:GNAT family N-acetyltransferase [Alkalibacterium sp. AK22]|uniref:GNAT family N-acetyltransferase n=1 Tax=Alkalibacterium sp. AK22 TaxID=1229520 RepID=UPI0004BAA7A1|nr:GNAT family N-acetyltransferase [Alkalibacterium sp. AK22]